MSPQPKQSNKTKNPNAYLKYSGMVMQLLVLLFIAAYLGRKLDEWMGNSPAYMTALLVLLAVVAYLVKIYFELSKSS